jgi:F-type H+-transporting ATPase subunit alpha
VEKQILVIYAGTNGFLDHLPVSSLKKYEQELYSFVESKYPDLLSEIIKKRELNDELRDKIDKVLEEFKARFKE